MEIEKVEGRIRIHAMIMIGLLFVQYLLGMTTNLFVTFPDHGTDGQFWEFAWSQWPEASHIVVGSLLLIGAVVLNRRAFKLGSRRWIIASLTGSLSILVAGGFGALFIPSQTDAYSFVMAVAFLVAISAYGFGLYRPEASSRNT